MVLVSISVLIWPIGLLESFVFKASGAHHEAKLIISLHSVKRPALEVLAGKVYISSR